MANLKAFRKSSKPDVRPVAHTDRDPDFDPVQGVSRTHPSRYFGQRHQSNVPRVPVERAKTRPVRAFLPGRSGGKQE